MSLHRQQFHDLVVRPALAEIDLDSVAATQLLMGTAAQESHFKYIHQLGKGPALGFFQMEPNTYKDIWANFLRHKEALADKLVVVASGNTARVGTYARSIPNERIMITNLLFAAAMCRVHYFRVKAALPPEDDWDAMAHYWKKYYNTHLGAGKPEEFLANVKAFDLRAVKYR